jgi:hypothetical protein
MPRISTFYGIAIYMYYKDHAPPHFHAIYGEHEATIDIRAITIHEGSLPRRAKTLVLEWATEHNEALMQNWELAQAEQPLLAIPPLD